MYVHYEDKSILRPSYLYNDNAYTLKDGLCIDTVTVILLSFNCFVYVTSFWRLCVIISPTTRKIIPRTLSEILS